MSVSDRDEGLNQLRDDLGRSQRRIAELERQLADSQNGNRTPDEQLDPDMIWIRSILSHQSGKGLVEIRWFTHLAQLDVESARGLAMQLLEAVEGANTDAFFASWLREVLKVDESRFGPIFAGFREYRERAQAERGEDAG